MFGSVFGLILLLISFPAWVNAAPTEAAHIWLYTDCSKLTFGVQDQLDSPGVHNIKYTVLFNGKGDEEFVVEKPYQLHYPNQVTYPDDFHFPKAPQLPAPPICGKQVEWRIYIDGVLNAYGVSGTQVQKVINKMGILVAPAHARY